MLDFGGDDAMDIDDDEDNLAGAPQYLDGEEDFPRFSQQTWREWDYRALGLAQLRERDAAESIERRRGKLWAQMRDEKGRLPRFYRNVPSKQRDEDVPIERPSSLPCNDRALRLGPRTWWDEKEL